MEIIGHRGAPRAARENTLAAFARALEAGVDAIELDVHATSDDELVVHHDPVVRSGGGATACRIARTPFARLREATTDAPVARLSQVLELVGARATVYVEIKGRHIEPLLARMLEARCTGNVGSTRTAVHSFDHRATALMRRLIPECAGGVLVSSYLLDPARVLRQTGARDYWQRWELVDSRLVRRIHDVGGRVIAWTVNRVAQAARLEALGVDGICTDRPAELVAALRATSRRVAG